jgi:hypothetical protein
MDSIGLQIMNPNYKLVRGEHTRFLDQWNREYGKEIVRLVNIGVLEEEHLSEWASSTFAILKENGTKGFATDFRHLSLSLKRHRLPISYSKDWE